MPAGTPRPQNVSADRNGAASLGTVVGHGAGARRVREAGRDVEVLVASSAVGALDVPAAARGTACGCTGRRRGSCRSRRAAPSGGRRVAGNVTSMASADALRREVRRSPPVGARGPPAPCTGSKKSWIGDAQFLGAASLLRRTTWGHRPRAARSPRATCSPPTPAPNAFAPPAPMRPRPRAAGTRRRSPRTRRASRRRTRRPRRRSSRRAPRARADPRRSCALRGARCARAPPRAPPRRWGAWPTGRRRS